jgi:hypothetical protein
MTLLGADLNDLRIATSHDGESVALTPLPGTGALSPEAKLDQLVAALSAQRPPAADAGVWIALSTPAEAQLPGELLRRLRAAGYRVEGFLDRAALLAAWLADCRELVVLEMAARRFSIDLAAREGEAAALRRHVALPGGALALQDAWLRLAAGILVQQTRFDPLHDAGHEASLRQQIPALAAQAQREGEARCALDSGRGEVTLSLTRDQFAAAAAPVLAPLVGTLQALFAAHAEAGLLVSESLLEIPGMDAVLSAARFVRGWRASEGLAARAASLLESSGAAADGGVPWRTRLPLLARSAPADALKPLAGDSRAPVAMATHIVFGGRALPIPAGGLVIGRDPGPAPAVQLPEGMAGLSRRHCTVLRDGARTQVIDHSSHGTFIDGARVRGRALLPAGATLRLGEPGIALPLIAIDAERPA